MTDIVVKRRSSWWRTPAYPAGSGPDFTNAAAVIETNLSPEAVLARLHSVEAALGRVRAGRWGARLVDLDLLAFGDQVLPDRETVAWWMALSDEEAQRRTPDQLLLPHPRLQERGFVLAPLAEVAPKWRHPITGATTAEMLAALPASALVGVERMDEPAPE